MSYDPQQMQPTQQHNLPPTYPQPAVPHQPYGAPAYYQPQPAPPRKQVSAGRVVLLVFVGFAALCLFGSVLAAITGDEDEKAPAAAVVTPAASKPPAQPPAALSPVEQPKPVKMPNVVGQNAAVAGDYLEKLGFTNIQYGSQDDLDTWVVLPENWTVKKQSAKKGSRLPTDTLIVLTCTKIG